LNAYFFSVVRSILDNFPMPIYHRMETYMFSFFGGK
jgi:hypothetical protein